MNNLFTAKTETRTISGGLKSRNVSEVVVYCGAVRVGLAANPETVQADLDQANSIDLTLADVADFHAAADKAERMFGNRNLFPLLWDAHQTIKSA